MTSDARRATPASRSRDASTSVVRPQSEAWLRLGGATRPSSRTARAAGLAFIVDIELKSLRPSLRDHADSSMRARERSLGEKGGVTQSGNCLARHGRVWCASLAVRLSRAPASALRLAVLIRRCSRSLARSSDPLRPPPQRDGSPPAQCDRFRPRAAHSIVTRATLSSDNRHSTHPATGVSDLT